MKENMMKCVFSEDGCFVLDPGSGEDGFKRATALFVAGLKVFVLCRIQQFFLKKCWTGFFRLFNL